MTTYTIGRDTCGNRVVRVRIPGRRGFSIQTNGVLPRTHRDGVGPWTQGEVSAHVRKFGTARQKEMIGA